MNRRSAEGVELWLKGELAALSVPIGERMPSLAPAEWEVFCLLTAGASNKAIARSRGTSVRTVAKQVGRILEAFDVRSRTELLAVWPERLLGLRAAKRRRRSSPTRRHRGRGGVA